MYVGIFFDDRKQNFLLLIFVFYESNVIKKGLCDHDCMHGWDLMNWFNPHHIVVPVQSQNLAFHQFFSIISVFINLIFVRGLVYVVGDYNVHHSCLLFFLFPIYDIYCIKYFYHVQHFYRISWIYQLIINWRSQIICSIL